MGCDEWVGFIRRLSGGVKGSLLLLSLSAESGGSTGFIT